MVSLVNKRSHLFDIGAAVRIVVEGGQKSFDVLLGNLSRNQLFTALVYHVCFEVVYIEVSILIGARFFNQALLEGVLVWELALKNSV